MGELYQNIDCLDLPRLPVPQVPGEHYWVMLTMHYLSDETAHHSESATLDAENLVAIGPPQCFACGTRLDGAPERCDGRVITFAGSGGRT